MEGFPELRLVSGNRPDRLGRIGDARDLAVRADDPGPPLPVSPERARFRWRDTPRFKGPSWGTVRQLPAQFSLPRVK